MSLDNGGMPVDIMYDDHGQPERVVLAGGA